MSRDLVTGSIVDAALCVHRELGPGLLETPYEACLEYELKQRGHDVRRQQPIAVVYKEVRMELGYRADLIVDHRVIVEVKSVETLAPIHHAQVLTYLKLTGLHTALLINFNVALIKDGIRRIVLNRPE